MAPLTPTDPHIGLAPSPADPKMMEKALRSLSSLPPFSPILTRLLASLAEEDVSFSMLGDLIEKDTVVAANILHLVNSALYARSGTISSVRHAISLLGTGKLRNAVLGMSIARVWNRVKMPPSWSMARFNMHSAAVALLSDLLAQRLPVTYPEGAFVAGLLHDVGRLLLALGLPNEYARIVERYHSGNQTLVDCEREIVGFTHAELSAQALHAWKLPEEIQIAARDHHSSLLPAAQEIPLSRVVDAANQYANAARLTILVTNHDCDSALAVESLGLDPDELQALLAEFREENDAMAKFFH